MPQNNKIGLQDDAKQYDPILLRWDRIDPLCEVITKHRIR